MTTKRIFRRTAALLLSLTILLSCMVWSGVSAAQSTYTTDFTGYTITERSDVSDFGSSYAKVVDSGEADHGAVMKLTYTDNTSDNHELGFRFFSGTGTKEQWNNGTDFLVEFDYKVEALTADAELRVLAGSVAWTGRFNTAQTAGASYWGVAADLKAATPPTGWQRASIAVTDCNYQNRNAIHIYMRSSDVRAQGGTSILIDNVKVISGVETVNMTLDYGYDSKTETLTGVTGQPVTFPTPTRDGYRFVGWNTKADGTGAVVSEATFAAGTTYYAMWEDGALQTVTVVQDFEDITSAAGFEMNDTFPYVLDTEGDTQTLRATIAQGANGNFKRPLWAFQVKGAATPFEVTPGEQLVVSFKVLAERNTNRVGFMLDTVNDLTALDLNPGRSAEADAYRTMQPINTTFGTLNAAGNETQNITLVANQWTTITATIPAVVAHGSGTQYLVLAITDAGCSATSWQPYDLHIDDVKVSYKDYVVLDEVSFDTNGGEPLDPVTEDSLGQAELPVPYRFGYRYTGWYEDAACTIPVADPYVVPDGGATLYTSWVEDVPYTVTLTQDFEDITSADGFVDNDAKPYVLGDDNGNQTLKVTLQPNYLGNFARPLWAFQVKGDTAPLEVTPGTALTVTFRVMAEKDAGRLNYMIDTVNDLTVLNKNPNSSAQADAHRTMQVLSSTSHGSLNAASNEVQNIVAIAGEWLTITATIPCLEAHGSGAQYLVLALTDAAAATSNKNWEDYDLHIDDVSISYVTGGQPAQVSYDTMGGEPLPSEELMIWTDLTAVPTRVGYRFTGWYADAALTEAVTTVPCKPAVTVYASWEETDFDPNLLHFEDVALGIPSFNRHGEALVSTDVNHTPDGGRSLRLSGISNAGADRNQFFIVDPVTREPYEFLIGESYTLTVWLYWEVQTSDTFNLNAWIWGTDDITEEFTTRSEKNDKNGLFEYDGAVIPEDNDGILIPEQWNKVSITFTPTNGKYMLVGMTNSATNQGGYTYYIDDLELTKPIPSVVTFDANGGVFDDADKAHVNDKGQYVVRSAVGLKVEGPSIDPYRRGKRFMGWATDKEGQNHFDLLTAFVPSAELTLYAMWGEWTEPEYDKIDKDNLPEKDEVQYKTEIQTETIWTGNAKLPILETGDPIDTQEADPVTYVPPTQDTTTGSSAGLPVWLIIVIIAAAVVVVGGGSVVALMLLRGKKTADKEVL